MPIEASGLYVAGVTAALFVFGTWRLRENGAAWVWAAGTGLFLANVIVEVLELTGHIQ